MTLSIRALTIPFIFLFDCIFIVLCILAGGERYWDHISYEHSHLTWLSSLQLFFIGTTCLTIWIGKSNNRLDLKKLKQFWLWPFLGFSFIFLSLDEKFQIHERLREGVFKPNHIGTNLPGIGAGDFLHILFAVIGLALSYFIYKQIKKNKIALIYLILALIISLYTVISDAFSEIPNLNSSQTYIEIFRFHQFTEEILEILAQLFFFSTFYEYKRTYQKEKV
ncbi:MAG: hypothetical protein CME66_02385 [Halobacteriovoraceae bacterium]|jgi:hypothetical protein|nr:hypothetical protein [Halobacteriovoraceae bacterium]